MKQIALLALFLLILPDFSSAQSVPQVFTGPATAVEAQSAVVTGDVNPNLSGTTAWFEYGTSFGLGNRTPSEFIGSGSAAVRIASTLTGLQANATYYYRAVAQGSSYGIQYGSIQTFVTKSGTNGGTGTGLPIIQLQAATDLGRTSISLHGRILPNGSDTQTWFEYGTTPSVEIRSESRPILATQAGLDLNFHLGGLKSGTKYYYRIAAQNAQGIVRSETRAFTTLVASGGGAPAPAPTSTTPSSTAPTSTPGGFNAVVTLIATSDQTEPFIGSEFNYTLEYRNDGSGAASGTLLHVTLPAEVEFVLADLVPKIEGRNLNFNIGSVPAGQHKSVRIRLAVKDDAVPTQMTIPALLTYRTPRNEERSATANISLTLREKPAETRGEFGGLRWYTWLFLFLLLLVALAVAYVFYRYGKSKRALG